MKKIKFDIEIEFSEIKGTSYLIAKKDEV